MIVAPGGEKVEVRVKLSLQRLPQAARQKKPLKGWGPHFVSFCNLLESLAVAGVE